MGNIGAASGRGVDSGKKVDGLIRLQEDQLCKPSSTISEENNMHAIESELKVHSKHNCYVLDAAAMQRLQHQVSVPVQLEVGTNIVTLRSGSFNYRAAAGYAGEPLVMLWIYGGKVVNQKTGVPVAATWSTLNGYDDTLTLEVLEPATLCAFFFDTYIEDNDGEVQLSIVRL